MFKLLLSLMIITTISFADIKKSSAGCILTQEGKFKVGIDDTILTNTRYIPIAKSGKNFRTIFVGSKVIITHPSTKKTIKAKIIDYKPNKRVRGKPKTGIFIVKITMQKIEKTIKMNYIFKDGKIKASTILDNSILKGITKLKSLKIWFETDITHKLCYTKIK